ncbi:MAG: tetratricopeptide repeat protein [Isosphaeraceae bacterium]
MLITPPMSNGNPASDEKFDQKLAQFKARLAENPLSGEVWLEYARFLHNSYSYDLAETIKALEKAQELCPDKDLGLMLGDALIRSGNVKEGLYQIYQFLECNPKAFGYRILASHLLDLGKGRRARKYLRRALVMDPKNKETYFYLGQLISRRSKSAAIPYYRKAIELDPCYQLAWCKLGYILVRQENSRSDGIEALKRALDLDPRDGWSIIGLGLGYWLDGQEAEAEKYYELLKATFPDDEYFNARYDDFQQRERKEGLHGDKSDEEDTDKEERKGHA